MWGSRAAFFTSGEDGSGEARTQFSPAHNPRERVPPYM